MPRLLPKVVQTLITQTPDATRVRDTLTSAVQPTLDFLNRYFQQAADGSLSLLARLVAKGATLNGDVNIFGNLLVVTRSANGVCIQPAGGGSPALYVTNVNNSVVLWYVNADGTCGAPSFVSGAGFKSFLDGGTYSNASAATSTNYQHQRIAIRGTTIVSANLVQPMGFSGSVIGIAVQYSGATTQNVGIVVNKNNTLLWNFPNILTSAATGALVVKTVAKGTYTFTTGDFLTVLSNYGTASSDVTTQVTLIIEQAA